MNEVKELSPNTVNNNPSGDNIPSTPLTEWSLIAVLFGFLVRGIWTHFSKELQADRKMLDNLVQHITEQNDKLIEESNGSLRRNLGDSGRR